MLLLNKYSKSYPFPLRLMGYDAFMLDTVAEAVED
jgi:hypothetical protein